MGDDGSRGSIWEVSDRAWSMIEPILDEMFPKKTWDFKSVDRRRVLNGIIFRLRTGCQWNKLPKEYGDDSTVHRYFQKWSKAGVFEKIWASLLAECDELGGVDWQWQSADGSMGKSRFGGISWARTRRIEARRASSAVS